MVFYFFFKQQSLASSHYGYSGGPEYGAWINKRRRVFLVPSTSEETFPANSDPYGGHQHFRSDLPDDDHLSEYFLTGGATTENVNFFRKKI
ncbi:unnamed protein product [Nesidiocoris tenuis]|uniref:Uncharacterized protein n=1 Tax=Nesidiocoris tenuis TaxID=355587 RepID=A0A6H5GGT8_9HEMI|nr:unnamed protein product [Nesidiocoris tenuis]